MLKSIEAIFKKHWKFWKMNDLQGMRTLTSRQHVSVLWEKHRFRSLLSNQNVRYIVVINVDTN
jgi:hypothetical protein